MSTSLLMPKSGEDFTSPKFAKLDSGLIVPTWYVKEVRRPKAFDFFAGCGGISLGLIQAGFEVVGALEYDADAAITYLTNLGNYPCQIHYVENKDRIRLESALQKQFNMDRKSRKVLTGFRAGSGWLSHNPGTPGVSHLIFGDAKKVTGAEILDAIGMKRGELDLVVGGPPCQGFSTAGKRDIADPRNTLVFDFARFIVDMNPKTMAMENVPGILNMRTPEGLPVVETFLRILEDGGFGTVDALKRMMGFKDDLRVAKRGSREGRQRNDEEKEEEACEQFSLNLEVHA